MEAQQCVQLTGTNRSFDLIALICQCASSSRRKKNGPSGPTRLRACRLLTKAVSPTAKTICFTPSFAGLVAFARRSDPIPSRTRPSNASAPMVLCLKTRESRSSPGLQSTELSSSNHRTPDQVPAAGWSSPVARQAHNLKAAGSNPAPATKSKAPAPQRGGFLRSRSGAAPQACGDIRRETKSLGGVPIAGEVLLVNWRGGPTPIGTLIPKVPPADLSRGIPLGRFSDSLGAGEFAPCRQRLCFERTIRRRSFGRWLGARKTPIRAAGCCR